MGAAADTADIVGRNDIETNHIGGNEAKTDSGMIRAMVRLLGALGFGAFLILGVILSLGLGSGTGGLQLPDSALASLLLKAVLLTAAALLAAWLLFKGLRRLEPMLDANAVEQARFLDTFDPRYVDLAIVVAAGLSLFLELALIRWQSSVLILLAVYKHFSPLACFAGLGLGYALASRSRIPLVLVLPLLVAQFCFILIVQ